MEKRSVERPNPTPRPSQAGFTSLRFTTSTVTHSDSGTDAAAAKRFFGESWATRTLETFGPQVGKDSELIS